MTFKRFEEIFKSRYPDGSVWMHDKFEHGAPGKRDKVAVVFSPLSKVYMYTGAYDAILQRVGIKCVSKEHLAEAEVTLMDLKDRHGKPDEFFGIMIDNGDEIARLEKWIEEVKRDYIIA